MRNPRKESTNLKRTLTPAEAGLVDLFTREDVRLVADDLDFIFELACFGTDGTLGDQERQALFTLWRIRQQYNIIFLEGHLLA